MSFILRALIYAVIGWAWGHIIELPIVEVAESGNSGFPEHVAIDNSSPDHEEAFTCPYSFKFRGVKFSIQKISDHGDTIPGEDSPVDVRARGRSRCLIRNQRTVRYPQVGFSPEIVGRGDATICEYHFEKRSRSEVLSLIALQQYGVFRGRLAWPDIDIPHPDIGSVSEFQCVSCNLPLHCTYQNSDWGEDGQPPTWILKPLVWLIVGWGVGIVGVRCLALWRWPAASRASGCLRVGFGIGFLILVWLIGGHASQLLYR
jgi:hypothetical protein